MAADATGATSRRYGLANLRVKDVDIVVIGAGPAGSACAALCASAGRKVLMLEAARFPRDKVCGDCINPSAWPVLDRLGLISRVKLLPSTSPKLLRFSAPGHEVVEFSTPSNSIGQRLIVVRRRDLDLLLVERAVEGGVEFLDGYPVTSLSKRGGLWEVTTAQGAYRARVVVAADGRSSISARLLQMHRYPANNGRIGLQSHIPHPSGYDGALEMRIYRNGYGGLADLGGGVANLCLVANEGSMKALQREVETYYHLQSPTAWRCITPISRPKAQLIARDNVFLSGDAARVMEPFTGEGISFALRSGALLAEILISTWQKLPDSKLSIEDYYARSHRNLYSGKLWINSLTRLLLTHPALALNLTPFLMRHPKCIEFLMKSVMH